MTSSTITPSPVSPAPAPVSPAPAPAPPGQAPLPSKAPTGGRAARRIVAGLLMTGLLTLLYAGMSVYTATQIVQVAPKPIALTPADFGLTYREVVFTSRVDNLTLKGWFIPGVSASGSLTTERAIIVVPGAKQNRSDPDAGALTLSAALARHGFAVLAYDPRGVGASQAAPFSMGYFEPRDTLGAVDFLRNGMLPYPELTRPSVIGGWGMSTGATTLLLAAAQEPAIQAIVSDTSSAVAAPLLQEQVTAQGGIGPVVPGAFVAARALYGIDFYAVRPVDVVAKLAPRPVFFIHGEHDPWLPASNLTKLVDAASSPSNAHVQSWIVPGVVDHAQTYHTAPVEYETRVLAFYTAALGPGSGQ